MHDGPIPFPARPAQEVMPLLQSKSLCFDAGGKRLIDNVDATILPGRRTVVMGANGAGKSLLLRLLHGLIRPSSGDILWQGHSATRAAFDAQAMVFQRPVMLRRSVLANLRFALTVKGLRGADRAAREQEAMERARLTELASRPARVLSGGEQQRLAVARALACKPDLLLLDEPTASLDPASTHAIEEMVADAHASGVTIVLITHDVGQARRMGDDVIFMDRGSVTETGPVARVLDTPQSSAAQAWLEGRLYIAPDPLRKIR
ncbi:ATP-binding cassette domain-containing protein [Pseudoruegeria sp. HB172150]|uniref:ATP-binding cassette domain-containing protein n=1 Tax=Pseudoruegeria sp. HB172150 TaxID=2721164 RepID=UPI0015561EC5|nr:ATP-binding cassette domain-containing protein [Pseudoruegeria sp. HB172150]